MINWQPIETAPTDGTKIIGLGYSRPEPQRNGDAADVRIIKAWTIGESQGWSALNNHSWFTVGFYPDKWMPLPVDGEMA